MKRLLLVFATLALAVASAKTYRLTLFERSQLSGTELKPGEYKVEVAGDKLTLTGGRTTVEAKVKVENADQKFSSTSVRYASGDGKFQIREIRFGGTNMKVVVN